MAKLTGFQHFLSALGYSVSGLRFAFNESAIRQEICVGILHVIALFLIPLHFSWKIFLSSLWVIVFITELVNTAIEAVVDLVSPQHHDLAKKAKDLGSAAVFCALLLFFGSWGFACLTQFFV